MEIIETGLSFSNLKRRSSTSMVVLHHSASRDVPAAEIHAWHLAKGWAGIGYHFVIRRNGSVERGRPLDMIGAHAGPEVNGSSIGICLTGDFMQEAPSASQIEALGSLLAWLDRVYAGSNPQGLAVKLHREVAATACPGGLFPAEEIRRRHPAGQAMKQAAGQRNGRRR
jgi:N-acetyl-anhydromuramyl-L-alanine amidase AmpD